MTFRRTRNGWSFERNLDRRPPDPLAAASELQQGFNESIALLMLLLLGIVGALCAFGLTQGLAMLVDLAFEHANVVDLYGTQHPVSPL